MPDRPFPVRCLYCGGARPSAAAPCAVCGAASPCDPAPPLDGERLTCPRCRTELGALALGDGSARVFRCATCLGCFTPVAAWSEILGRMSAGERSPLGEFVPLPPGKELPPAVLLANVPCPRCRGATERITFGVRSKVVADICTRHGIWFDAVEIVRAAQFVKKREENRGVVPTTQQERDEERQHILDTEARRAAVGLADARDQRMENMRRHGSHHHDDPGDAAAWLWRR